MKAINNINEVNRMNRMNRMNSMNRMHNALTYYADDARAMVSYRRRPMGLDWLYAAELQMGAHRGYERIMRGWT